METKRVLLFLFGCILTRVAFAYIAYRYQNTVVLQVMGVFALIIATGFLVIWIGGYRKTGAEVFGEKIWWNHLRPVHAILYLTFAVMAFTPAFKRYAWVPLAVDVAIGLTAWILHHYIL